MLLCVPHGHGCRRQKPGCNCGLPYDARRFRVKRFAEDQRAGHAWAPKTLTIYFFDDIKKLTRREQLLTKRPAPGVSRHRRQERPYARLSPA